MRKGTEVEIKILNILTVADSEKLRAISTILSEHFKTFENFEDAVTWKILDFISDGIGD